MQYFLFNYGCSCIVTNKKRLAAMSAVLFVRLNVKQRNFSKKNYCLKHDIWILDPRVDCHSYSSYHLNIILCIWGYLNDSRAWRMMNGKIPQYPNHCCLLSSFEGDEDNFQLAWMTAIIITVSSTGTHYQYIRGKSRASLKNDK